MEEKRKYALLQAATVIYSTLQDKDLYSIDTNVRTAIDSALLLLHEIERRFNV